MALDIKINTVIGSTSVSTLQKKTTKNGASATSTYSAVVDFDQDTASATITQTQGLNPISVDHLISLTAAAYEKSSNAIQYGHDMLTHLEQLRDDILKGELSLETLQQIRSRITDASIAAVDPKLRCILDDIRIRAEVELAKWDVKEKS